MLTLPPVAPATGWRSSLRLPDVRADARDFRPCDGEAPSVQAETDRRCPMSPPVEPVRRHRHELWVDNLRVVLIAGVIVVHTATA